MASKKRVIVRVPHKAWQVLIDSLKLDSESGAFDQDLREQIQHALDSVEAVDSPWRKRQAWWVLIIPEADWAVMEETLVMDMNSKWTDKELRKQLRKAFDQVDVEPLTPRDWSPRWSH